MPHKTWLQGLWEQDMDKVVAGMRSKGSFLFDAMIQEGSRAANLYVACVEQFVSYLLPSYNFWFDRRPP